MIGDWVLTLESTHKEQVYAQIWAIEEGQTSILVKKDNCNWFVDIDWLEPIPLTPEILEKNGFERLGTDYILMGYPFGLTNPSTPDDYKDNYWLRVAASSVNIKYVHELQHALRLCGIEKEITLDGISVKEG